jgi:CRP-like cAMP-binding protein
MFGKPQEPSMAKSPKRPAPPRSFDTAGLLSRHPIFGVIDPRGVAQLCTYATSRRVARGSTLFCKGDPGDALYAIVSGTMKISVPAPDGREAVFNLLHPGEVFGEIALLDGRPRTADAVAFTDCDLIMIDRRDFRKFIESQPAVAMKLIELLCERLRVASEHVEELVFLDLPTRLARTLLRLDEAAGEREERVLSITQIELSHILGVTRESINKQLRAWARQKLIRIERGGIVVTGAAGLSAQAERP